MVKISKTDKRFTRLNTPSLSEAAILERCDLQEYIFNSQGEFYQEIGQDFWIVGKEVSPSDAVADRIDLLAVDSDGVAVIIELKRGSHRLQLFQAISYAGMIAGLSHDALLARQGVDPGRAKGIEGFLGDPDTTADQVNHAQRIILVAEAFDYGVLFGAKWLYEKFEVDVACIQVAVAEDGDARYLSFVQVFPTRELDEVATRHVNRTSGGVAAVPSSWDEILSKVTNQAVANFFRKHLESGTKNKLKYRQLEFPIGGEGRLVVHARSAYARVGQAGRFSDDIDFWRSRISAPDSVHVGTKRYPGDQLFFQVSTTDDFAALEKAIMDELAPVKWERSPTNVDDPAGQP